MLFSKLNVSFDFIQSSIFLNDEINYLTIFVKENYVKEEILIVYEGLLVQFSLELSSFYVISIY